MVDSNAADSTRERIVRAAKAEFAQHGIAGARVNRIAEAARTSKERVYSYFRSKEALYAFVVGQELAAMAEATRMDPADLPGYAGRLFDYYTDNPENFRLLSWGRLEAGTERRDPDGPIAHVLRGKVGQIRDAQAAGRLDPSWEPLDAIALVGQIAATWVSQPELAASGSADGFDVAARRAARGRAGRRLVPAPGRDEPEDR